MEARFATLLLLSVALKFGLQSGQLHAHLTDFVEQSPGRHR